MNVHPGIGISRGISIAPVFQFRSAAIHFDTYKVKDPQKEWARFQDASRETLEVLEKIYEKAVAEVGTDEAGIFHAHMTILQDPDLNDGVQGMIVEDLVNAEAALFEVSEEYCRMLEEINDDYLRARVVDIRDVRDTVLRSLLKLTDDPGRLLDQPSVIVSQDLTPSDCLSMDRNLIRGFCTIEGGITSHTAILARSLGVPAMVGVSVQALDVPTGETVVLDGYEGKLITEPDSETLRLYENLQNFKQKIVSNALAEADLPAQTTDGFRVKVYANIGSDSPEDLKTAVSSGAEGVGLLRTEFIYLDCSSMPDEEYQYAKYKAVVEAFGDRPVILRTLDIGGDKQLPYLNLPYELNPFLGVRGLRLCLRNPALFKTQLRAALRASASGRLQIMFPMVTKASEIRAARSILEECRAELANEGQPMAEHIEIGIMIEIPAAALLADHLAREVDFFSIGTNDLSQYTLAVDRTNTTLADLANAYDPAVLRLIKSVVDGAHRYGKPVGVCGELAGEPMAIPILIGLDLDELSMNPPVLPLAKQIIRAINHEQAQALAEEVLELDTPAEVQKRVGEVFPFLLDYS